MSNLIIDIISTAQDLAAKGHLSVEGYKEIADALIKQAIDEIYVDTTRVYGETVWVARCKCLKDAFDYGDSYEEAYDLMVDTITTYLSNYN